MFALDLEGGAGFPPLFAAAAAVWVAQERAPASWRRPSLLLLFAGAAFARLGWGAAFVIAAGVGVAELAALPTRRRWRVVALAVAGLALGAVRGDLVDPGVPNAALVVFASLFVFRVALVVADPASHLAPRTTRWTYFFQFPNVVFPLYPVVDWTRWQAVPRDLAALRADGVRSLVRGATHLLAFRLVYHLVLPADWEIVDARSLAWWMLAGFLLYVRVSGTFHLAVGWLQLFGHDLPRTHDHYLLAAGFGDHYRRVNRYFTAFLERLVFVPTWFALKARKVPLAHVVAVWLTFAASWALHHWQKFWILGRWEVTATDTTFWATLGTLVALDTWWTTRGPVPRRGPWTRRLVVSTQVVGTFLGMVGLWSLWKSPTFELWLARLDLALGATPAEIASAAASLVVLVGLGVVVQAAIERPRAAAAWARGVGPGASVAWLGVATAALWAPLPDSAPELVASVQQALSGEHLSRGDRVAKTQGYYDDLAEVTSLDRPSTNRPEGWLRLRETRFARPFTASGIQYTYELVPSTRGLFHGMPLETNRHGMRDQEYTVAKPPGTYRIALIGASPEMGEGVAADEVFEAIVERRLNRRYGSDSRRYEILNFAVSGRTLETHLAEYRFHVRPFDPDLVLVADHSGDTARVMSNVAHASCDAVPPALSEVCGRFGPDAVERDEEERRPSGYHGRDAMVALFRALAHEVKADGALIAWLSVPVPPDLSDPVRFDVWRAGEAKAAGMIPIELDGAYGSRPRSQLEVAPWDVHPNALGHRLLARQLFRELVHRDEELGLKLGRRRGSDDDE